VSKRTYLPDRGDLVEMNLRPAAGREIDKRRPAIVLSPLAYNRKSGLCLAVPVSTDLTPGPLWIPMPPGLLPRALTTASVPLRFSGGCRKTWSTQS